MEKGRRTFGCSVTIVRLLMRHIWCPRVSIETSLIDEHDERLLHNNSSRHAMMDFMVINRIFGPSFLDLKSSLKNSG